jgi:ankyrin repeat protein
MKLPENVSEAFAIHDFLELQGWLAQGGNIDWRDDSQRSLLYRAVESRDLEMAGWLLKNGADANLPDEWGVTPLHLAAKNSDKAAVELLLGHKAEVNAKTHFMETAMMYSMYNGLPVCDYETPYDFSAQEDVRDLIARAGGKSGRVRMEHS